ncbi:MAG: hypothetical protein NXI27_21115 [Alphaproteobacteria bacterium]|nr:hypothetical protein [Alphaproteobacteria bacterium]
MNRILVDGRIFSSCDQGEEIDGVRQLIQNLFAMGYHIEVLLFEGCVLGSDDPIINGYGLQNAPFSTSGENFGEEMHRFTRFLTRLLHSGRFDIYVDATPHLGPLRLEVPTASTLAVADEAWFSRPEAGPLNLWRNTMLRLDRADGVICKSVGAAECMRSFLCKQPGHLVTMDHKDEPVAGLDERTGSPAIDALRDLAVEAVSRHQEWRKTAGIQVFSSIPGTFCGIADHTTAHLHDYVGVAALHFSEGDPSRIAPFNVRLFSYLDFDTVSDLCGMRRLFQFGVSEALLPGIELMLSSGRAGDVVVIHERRFMHGLESIMRERGRTQFLGQPFLASQEKLIGSAGRATEYDPADGPMGKLVQWLGQSGITLVSPLSPASKSEFDRYVDPLGAPARNELKPIEGLIHDVPFGMDERALPDVLRAARRLKSERGIPAEAIVLGHFGQIIDEIKLLRETAAAFVQVGCQLDWHIDERPLFLLLCGKIVDAQLVADIRQQFRDVGAQDRLLFSTPFLEEGFDAEMRICTASICFRKQAWGHQSNAMIRSLALGVPALVNTASGWSYDPATTIDDDNIASGLHKALGALSSPRAIDLRHWARKHYEDNHRADVALDAMLRAGFEHAATH